MSNNNFYTKLIITTIMVIIAEIFMVLSVPKVHAMDVENMNNKPGINLMLKAGKEISAPFDSTVTILNSNTILLRNTNNDEEIIVIEGIKLDKDLDENDVHEGEKLGTTESSSLHVCYWEKDYPTTKPITERPFIIISKLAN